MLPELSFNRLQPTDQECEELETHQFSRYNAREAVLDEEYWVSLFLFLSTFLYLVVYIALFASMYFPLPLADSSLAPCRSPLGVYVVHEVRFYNFCKQFMPFYRFLEGTNGKRSFWPFFARVFLSRLLDCPLPLQQLLLLLVLLPM